MPAVVTDSSSVLEGTRGFAYPIAEFVDVEVSPLEPYKGTV
jgi:hypothetical protein